MSFDASGFRSSSSSQRRDFLVDGTRLIVRKVLCCMSADITLSAGCVPADRALCGLLDRIGGVQYTGSNVAFFGKGRL